MYSLNTRIRYSECDSHAKLTLESLLNYFQDCTSFHSEDKGVGIQYLRDNHQVWVLSAWQIIINRYPAFGENVKVATFPYEFRGCFGSRNFIMETENGEQVAIANSLWTLLDSDSMLPAKPDETMKIAYELNEKLDMDYAPRKIAVSENGERREPIQVKKHHLDTNNHVNNGQYVRMALDSIPEEKIPKGFKVQQLRAEYKQAAYLGDDIVPVISIDGNRFTVALQDTNGKSYAIVELQ
ncbi:MAG: thioesterase [Lachnospiraceae bacterium]|nr:thioesterase [Lachnospiraceae bacterium]